MNSPNYKQQLTEAFDRAHLPGGKVVNSLHAYNTAAFSFPRIFIDFLNKNFRTLGVPTVESLSHLHQIQLKITSSDLYGLMYDCMDTAEFRQTYRNYVRELVVPLFDVPLVYQKKPGIRVHFPDGKTVQHHTDEWYGHGSNVINCWLPLTAAFGSNTLHVASWEDSVREITFLEQQQLSMSEMNDYLAQFAKPVETSVGHLYIFNAQCVHGTVSNTTGQTRVSLDFRLLLAGGDAGSKDRDYYENVNDESKKPVHAAPQQKNTATSYLFPRHGFTKYIPQMYQRLIVSTFAKAHNIDLVAEETEIKTMSHHPILLDLARGTGIHNVNAVVLYSVACLPIETEFRHRVYELARASGVKLFFANERLSFPELDEAMLEKKWHSLGESDNA